jgi:hypothetical protein
MSSNPERLLMHIRGRFSMTTSFTQAALAASWLLLAAAPMADDAPTAPVASPDVASPDAASVDTSVVPDPVAGDDAEAEQEVPAMRFDSPDAAAMALIEAAGDEERGALFAVLGSDIDSLTSGDPVADAADRRRFVELAGEGAHLEDETEDSAILVIGPEDWPFPIPLAKDETGWYFDTEAGIEEILDRRVGLNELYAIAAARAYVDAQLEYAAEDSDGDGVGNFALRFLSSAGGRDGLYWPTAEGEPQSPLGPLFAEAVDEGYLTTAEDVTEGQGPRPFHGYFFKILTGQGAAAPGGARTYLRDGKLVDGFGLVAWPATYGNSGIMSFQVNQRGIVYEADLGEETAALASAMTEFDPGEGWEPTVDVE